MHEGDDRHGGADEATEAFLAHRSLLFTVAYELLGSATDSEDVLQETWLRWSKVDLDQVRDRRAYLVRITTRLTLNPAACRPAVADGPRQVPRRLRRPVGRSVSRPAGPAPSTLRWRVPSRSGRTSSGQCPAR